MPAPHKPSFSIPPHLTPLQLTTLGFLLLAEAARRAAIVGMVAGVGTDETYSTRRGHGPPGISHRRWCKHAPHVPGAVRLGRWWIVPRIAWVHYAQQISQERRSSRR